VTDELASQPGAVATRSEDQEGEAAAPDLVLKPLDFRLNLQARLAEPAEPLTNLDSPSIRKLTWEHVVPDRPEEPAPSAAATVPLPPPAQVPPPPPLATSFEPPPSTGQVHVVAELSTVDKVVEEAVVAADVVVADAPASAVEVRVVEEPAAEAIPAVPPPPGGEVNRLALVPDLVVDDSPVELPPITPSGGPYVAQPSGGPYTAQPSNGYVPVLPETVFVAAPRATTAATNVATLIADGGVTRQGPRKKSTGRMLRSFMTLVLLFGMLGGGAFAAKKYLIDKAQPKWSADIEPFATEVAAARGLQFKTSVEVTTLPAGGYASRLTASVFTTQPGRAETWRALGLLNGNFDLEAIGRQALNDSPAFYDPATKTIYVSDDLKPYEHVYRFAIHRALTTALLDQQYDWSTRVSAATPAAALALRATIDGDALAVANSLAEKDSPDQFTPEWLTFVQGHPSVVAPSQYAAAVAGRSGVAMRSTVSLISDDPRALAALEQATPASDAVFDAARSLVASASPPGTQGMIFWYYALAGRIDDTQAWTAVAHWTGDSMVVSSGSGPQCVDAKIAADDPGGAALLLGAFQAWAAAAPAESATTVAPIEGNQVAIRACDPGSAVAAQAAAKVPVAFGGAGTERALVQAAESAASQTKVDPACLIKAARQRGTALTSPADDPPVLADGWQPAYVTANLDLATGCVIASG
jgi:hypothetical protein